MSTLQKPKPKPAPSRWGFLSQAVASVESGLDKILAEEESSQKKSPPTATKAQENGLVARASTDSKRNDSTNRVNDRLQTRLSQAMASKGTSRAATPVPGSEAGSRPDTPALVADPQRKSHEAPKNEESRTEPQEAQEHENVLDVTGRPSMDVTSTNSDEQNMITTGTDSKQSLDTARTLPATFSERVRSSSSSFCRSKDEAPHAIQPSTAADTDAIILNMQTEHEKSLSTLQEELNGYLERIDALQRNMQMLTNESIANAKQIKADTESTTHDKQLADKDEKIALLIEEGTKLTKSEMQYRNMIKKLRSQATTLSNDQDAVRQRAERSEKMVSTLKARALKAEHEARQNHDQLVALSKSSSDTAAITKERAALQATLADVRAQLGKANNRAEEAESKAQSDKYDAERRRAIELEDDLRSAKVERELAEDKLRQEISDLKQTLAREKEQTRQMETEMLAEQASLESKLEGFRLRTEEMSTGDQGDSQAKLLRQIEHLQSQYSTASQNWQGIETTLLTRITTLEKERDEFTGREADLRRKLRDASTKARNACKDLEETQHSLREMQDRQANESAESQRASRRVAELEKELARLGKELEEQKSRTEKDVVRRIEEEKAKWIACIPQSVAKIDSPVASLRKFQGGLFMDSLTGPLERPSSRRSSTLPFNDFGPHSRIHSSTSLRANGTIPETPSIVMPDDQDDFFGSVPATPASANRAESTGRNVNDVISASTAGAGPSVQLVERLSTNVRRLESEKAASKDEIVRLSSQRDEARQEVVNLMREVEQKRTADDRLTKLEQEHSALSAKHRATLELLGEKTEQVDELKADILDIKQMYRHLADTMGK